MITIAMFPLLSMLASFFVWHLSGETQSPRLEKLSINLFFISFAIFMIVLAPGWTLHL